MIAAARATIPRVFRYHRRQSSAPRRRKADLPRNRGPARAPQSHRRHPRNRAGKKLNVDRNINTRVKRQMERRPKRVLPQRKAQSYFQKELGRGEKAKLTS